MRILIGTSPVFEAAALQAGFCYFLSFALHITEFNTLMPAPLSDYDLQRVGQVLTASPFLFLAVLSPFDGAAYARNLILRTRLAAGDRPHRLEQVAAHIRQRGGLRCVQPAVVLKLELRVEAEEFRRAHGAVGLCHFLRFVQQVGKAELAFARNAL